MSASGPNGAPPYSTKSFPVPSGTYLAEFLRQQKEPKSKNNRWISSRPTSYDLSKIAEAGPQLMMLLDAARALLSTDWQNGPSLGPGTSGQPSASPELTAPLAAFIDDTLGADEIGKAIVVEFIEHGRVDLALSTLATRSHTLQHRETLAAQASLPSPPPPEPAPQLPAT